MYAGRFFVSLLGKKLSKNGLLKSSDSNSAHIALVEIGRSHDECLLPQIQWLKEAGCKITLVCNPEIRERNPIFEHYVHAFIEPVMDTSQWKDFWKMRKLVNDLRNAGVDKVVFNTAQGGHIRNACRFARKTRLECIGIIHTTRKFDGSFTQKLISKTIKKYFLLSKFLKERSKVSDDIQLEYFYPIHSIDSYPDPAKEQLTITLIGSVENRRKDLDSIPELIAQLPENAQLVFLGKSDASSEDRLKLERDPGSENQNNRLIFYDAFVPQEEFDRILKQSHFLLPLVHPDTPSADQYLLNQIPGAMILSFAYHIPLLLHKHYKNHTELATASYYYTTETFGEIVQKGFEELKEKRNQIKSEPSYQIDTQKKRYLDFVLS